MSSCMCVLGFKGPSGASSSVLGYFELVTVTSSSVSLNVLKHIHSNALTGEIYMHLHALHVFSKALLRCFRLSIKMSVA